MKPNFEIIDIMHLIRKKSAISTSNKNCFVLSCRLNGESTFFYNNSSIKVKKGDVLYIPEGASYMQSTMGEEILFLHLRSFDKAIPSIKVFSVNDGEKMCEYFKSIFKLWSENKDKNFYKCMQYLYKILDEIDLEEKISSNILFKAVSYIEKNMFSPDLSLDEACKVGAISRVYFNKLFKKEYNLTPIQFINSKRIQRAKFLLQTGIYAREEIASLCGFNEVKYFYSIFKKITKMTTSQYLNSFK